MGTPMTLKNSPSGTMKKTVMIPGQLLHLLLNWGEIALLILTRKFLLPYDPVIIMDMTLSRRFLK